MRILVFKHHLKIPGQEPSLLTHAQPPNKTVVNEMVQRAAEAAEYKLMPFVQLVGDQHVYALILELKHENPEKFKKILPKCFHGHYL